jgi:beta-1,2-mannobiose phosphorylase / 1,2-beta-oligomannan phosphorylase
MAEWRCPENPIINPSDVRALHANHEVIGVFNAGVVRVGTEVVLLLRIAERPKGLDPAQALATVYNANEKTVETIGFDRHNPEIDCADPRVIITPGTTYLTSVSYLRPARSDNGIHFAVDYDVALLPETPYEAFGLEDPRISLINGVYYIDYVAVSSIGVTTSLASTRDFRSFARHGVIFGPENKDVAIFPESIDGLYYALHRPASPFSQKNEIWLAQSPDLLCWGNHRYVMGLGPGAWDQARIGPGAVPFKIEGGWLEVYHGVDAHDRYCLGAVLLDAKAPWRVLARSRYPIFSPERSYECDGFFGNVVFTCGLLYAEDKLKLYYGAADTSICYAEIPLDDVLKSLEAGDNRQPTADFLDQ